MKRLVTILAISLLLISSFAQNQWQLAKDKNGIKVYVKPMPDTHLKACKTITVINAPVEKVFRVIRDIKNAPRWVENVSYARELEAGKDYYYCYQIIKIGYGIKDRDIITYETIHHYNDGKIKITIKGAPDRYPRQKGKVRIEKVNGYWILEPVGRDKTKLTYEFFSDPKNIPAWIINAFITETPYKTIYNLKKLAEKK